MNNGDSRSFALLIACPDRKGIVAAVTAFLARHKGNIIHLDQHVDFQENVFFMRVEWEERGFALPAKDIPAGFEPIARDFQMDWTLHCSDKTPRMALFVSREPHCLYDVLSRVQSGEWNVAVPVVISNHTDMENAARQFGIPYCHIPIVQGDKAAQERAILERLRKERIDFVVLARYMQILSGDFVAAYPNRIINIHHSFLPAFPGARPYHSAYARGVKIVGATSHYVTAELDTGPIIEQDIIRVSHKDSVEDLVRKGKDLERVVLARAIWWHLRNRILIYSNKTVVFD